jgi:exonuclease VII large subunit
MAGEMRSQDQGSVPSPDPTERTKQDLLREIEGLKEFMNSRIDAVLDKAVERSREIEARLGREEQHRLENKQDTTQAVDRALDAQRQIAERVERGLDKQLAEIKASMDTTIEGLRRELGDLKDRLGKVESTVVG